MNPSFKKKLKYLNIFFISFLIVFAINLFFNDSLNNLFYADISSMLVIDSFTVLKLSAIMGGEASAVSVGYYFLTKKLFKNAGNDLEKVDNI